MRKAVIFDVDGTLIDSVDFHALAWHEAFARFGHAVSFEAARSQIGKGGDQLLPVFLSEATISEQGEEIEKWRGDRFKSAYLALVRPFSAVPELMNRLRQAGVAVAVASSAKKEELGAYLDIADVTHLVDVTVSSDDAANSKPAPDVFQSSIAKLGILGCDAVTVGDSPYDAEAAVRAGIEPVGVLCGGFTDAELRTAGCIDVYPGPASLFACLEATPLLRKSRSSPHLGVLAASN
jgi:phosphoglycolate phosphatase-like HAD superfamily hydrolase